MIVIAGLPGSGKGTQGDFLSARLGYVHISTGDIFRDAINKADENADLLDRYLTKGELVPSDLVNGIVERFLLTQQNPNKCILDGYPRNIEQAIFLANLCRDVIFIYFEISQDVVIERILDRFSCANCRQIYNKKSIRPKIDNVCDVCGGTSFIRRNDDELTVVHHRIALYLNETRPVIEYYANQGRLIAIDATKNQEDVYLNIIDHIKMV